MPKMKTKSSAKKRFSITGSGKIKRKHAFKSHILTKKATTRAASASSHTRSKLTPINPVSTATEDKESVRECQALARSNFELSFLA